MKMLKKVASSPYPVASIQYAVSGSRYEVSGSQDPVSGSQYPVSSRLRTTQDKLARPTAYRLLATGYRLLAIGYRLVATGFALLLACLLPLAAGFGGSGQAAEESKDGKAIQAIQRAIETLGGNAFLQVRDITSSGKYYQLRKGNTTLAIPYQDYTKLPNKSRYEEGGKKSRDIYVFNLEAGKGWTADMQKGVTEASKEEVDRFKKTVKHAIENILRTRYREPAMKLYYYSPDEVSSKRKSEAVELLDDENDSVVVYFDSTNHYPLKVEYTEIDAAGRKLKVEEEFSNWHNIQGIMTPFRIDSFTEGEQSSQRFIEKIAYNTNLPESLFTRPQIQIKSSKDKGRDKP